MCPRVAFVTTSMAPYKIALFNALHARFSGEIKVFFMFPSESFREWAIDEKEIHFDYQYLDRISCPPLEKRSIFLNRRVMKALKAYGPDLVINNNYAKPANVAAYLYSKLYHKRFVMMEEYHTRYYKNNIVSRILRKIMQRGSDGFIACHKGAYAYLIGCGVSAKKIILTQETVDMRWYRESVEEFKKTSEYNELRSSYKENVLIYIGQLIKRKNVGIIIDAAKKYIDVYGDNITLLIVGGGLLENQYQDRVTRENLGEYIVFFGYLQKKDIIKYLAISKALVLPSTHEIWGLVVNEALAAGIVPIVSHSVGAAELMMDNINGYLFHPHRSDELADCLALAFRNYEELQPRIKRSAEGISLDRYVDAFISAVGMFSKTKDAP